MAVREFDGTDDRIRLSTGATDVTGAFTVAVILKLLSSGTHCPASGMGEFNSKYGFRLNFGAMQGHVTANFTDVSTLTFGTADGWMVAVFGRAAGALTTGRGSKCVMSSATWSHADSSGTQADPAPLSNGFDIGNRENGTDLFHGRIAVAGVWKRNLSDTERETLESSLKNWVDLSPDGLWALNQASTATPVEDITAGNADQTAITGTTVVTGDDPPGFDFSLTSFPTALLRRVRGPNYRR